MLNTTQLKRLNDFKSLSNPTILIQRADRLGDAIFVGPVIEQIHDTFPNATIDLLTSSVGCDLFYHHPNVNDIRILNNEALTNARAWFKELQFLKQKKYDAYICLWNHPRLAWLGFAAYIPIRCGDSSSLLLSLCFNHATFLPWANITYHQINYNCMLLSGLGINSTKINRTLYPDPDSYESQYAQWKQSLSHSKNSVVILCGTGGSSDPIPSQVIIDWIKTTKTLDGYCIILVGQLSDDDPLTTFEFPNTLNKINQTSLSELITLIDLADIVIGGDTGPSHLASFLNKPQIFYSPLKRQLPSAWGPFSDYAVILREDYLKSHDSKTPLTKLLDTAFHNLSKNPKLTLATTEEEKQHRLLKNSIRVLVLESAHSKLSNNNLSCIETLKSQGLILFTKTLPILWIFNLFLIINTIRQRNITVIMAHRLPLGLLSLIRFIMGTIFQYRKPLFVNLNELTSDKLEDVWKLLKTKEW